MTESFTGIYSVALKELCASIDPKDFVLFMFLCAHASGNGICYPGVKKIAQELDLRFEEVRYRLDRLERQGLIRFLRRGARDTYTGEFLPDLYQMNPRVYLAKSPVTHFAENAEPDQLHATPPYAEPDQFRTAPVQPSQPESEPEAFNQNQKTRISNQHQQPENASFEERMAVTGGAAYGWESEVNTDTKANANAQDSAQSAPAGTKPVPTGHAEGKTSPSSAPPPSAWQPEPRYVNALPDAKLEALANELKAIAPTRLYNARELVMKYGEPTVRKALTQLIAAKAKGNVYNPCGLLTKWLQTGAVQSDVEMSAHDEWMARFNNDPYRHIIKT